MPPGRAAAPSPASSAPRLRARPAAPSPPASDASRPTSLHPELPFPARALPQGPGMLHFTPDSATSLTKGPQSLPVQIGPLKRVANDDTAADQPRARDEAKGRDNNVERQQSCQS